MKFCAEMATQELVYGLMEVLWCFDLGIFYEGKRKRGGSVAGLLD